MSVTVRAVLFDQSDPGAVMAGSPGWSGVTASLSTLLAAFSAGTRSTVERELSGTLAGLLNLDLGEVLVAGWRRHRALVAAARATQAEPAATEVVELAAHRIVTTHRPYVDVVVNGATVATVHCDLGLTVDVDALTGTVRQGRLVSVQSGRCTVAIGLGCEGRELASRQVELDPAVVVRLGDGISLLPA